MGTCGVAGAPRFGDFMKKTVITLVVALFAVADVVAAICFLPKNSAPASSVPQQTSSVSSIFVQHYTLEQLVTTADSVITGTVIKADVENGGVLYTMNVEKVYKGRNYTSMGYAYLAGKQSLTIGQSYLFVGKTGTEKYHYYEPIAGVPWVFFVQEGGGLSASCNGNVTLLDDLAAATLQQVISLCDII